MTPAEIQTVVSQTLQALGLLKPIVSQAEAYRMYGRSKVTYWTKVGLLKTAKDTTNGKKRYSRTELENIALKNNVLNKYLKP